MKTMTHFDYSILPSNFQTMLNEFKNNHPRHSNQLAVHRAAKHLGLPMEASIDLVNDNWGPGRPPNPGEIEQGAWVVYEVSSGNINRQTAHKRPKIIIDPQIQKKAFDEFAGQPVTMEYVAERSPINVRNPQSYPNQRENCASLIDRVFAPTDPVWIGKLNDNTNIRSASEWSKKLRNIRTDIPPQFIPNPLSGRYAEMSPGKFSKRCCNAVVEYNHTMVEMDNVEISIGHQLAFWMRAIECGEPVKALIYSGGKSIHALLNANGGTDRSLWEEIGSEYELKYRTLGFDANCNPVHPVRFPGHYRHDTGRFQVLCWLA